MKKQLFYLFLILIILKIILSLFIQFPLGFSDSLTYQESAKAFWDTLSITKIAESKYPLLYPLIISPAFAFNDMNIVLFTIKIINSILSSLIIFPVYLLSKEFLNKKKSFLLATISAFIPPFFIFTFTSMSENLFYPLFIFTIYALYKAFKSNEIKWNITAGASVGLCFLIKIMSIFIIPVIFVLILLNFKQFQEKTILLFTTLITISAWIIPRVINYGFNLYQILGYQASLEKATSSTFFSTKIIWFFLYIDYLILASGIVLFILAIALILKYKKLNPQEKLLIQLTILSTFFLLILCANHSGGFEKYTDYRTIGRYIECLIPLYLLLGFIYLEKKDRLNKRILLLTSIFIITSSYFLLFDKFFPLNNSSLIHIGILKYGLDMLSINSILIITVILALILTSIFFLKKFNKIYSILLIYFIILTLANISIMFYDTQERWLPTEGAQLGQWINENLSPDSTFLFDIQEKKEPLHKIEIDNRERPTQIAAYWIRGEWTLDKNAEYDYIITNKDLENETIYQDSSIKIYKA
jgi:4-amino-4-deoxy-L-arabinose transferase-like glycosyltransferase